MAKAWKSEKSAIMDQSATMVSLKVGKAKLIGIRAAASQARQIASAGENPQRQRVSEEGGERAWLPVEQGRPGCEDPERGEAREASPSAPD